MSNFLNYTVPGIPAGCTFALVAVGLVLTYRATGVFNFGFAAEAYAAAIAYAELCLHGVAPMWSLVIVVLIAAPLFGAMMDFAFFSRIPRGDRTAKTIMALGIMVVVPILVELMVGPVQIYNPPSPALDQYSSNIGSVYFTGLQLITVIVTFLVLGLLSLLLRSRRFGLPIRAAVESPRLLELNGVNSRWVLRSAWMISTTLAALSGVLFAAQPGLVDATNFSVLLVAAIAAAALGGLRSLPLAVAGGIAMGVIQGLVQGYVPNDSVWYAALVPSLPFFLLLGLLLFHPALRRLGVSSDPMATIEPPPPPPALAMSPPIVNRVLRRYRWPILIGSILVTVALTSGIWVYALTVGVALSIIFLSITLMTGLAGQLSLAQATFAGIGALTTAQLVTHTSIPVMISVLIGATIAAIGGVVASLPALRLRGLPVTLLTLCLALLADKLLFPTSWIGGGTSFLSLPRPHAFGIDMEAADSKSFLILCFGVLLVVAGVVNLLLRGTSGRALAAVHASEAGASASGVAVRRMTIWVFLLSALIAGVGGAMYAMTLGEAGVNDYNWFFGPTFLVIVVTVGATAVEGAIEAGIGFALVNQAVTYLPSRFGGSSAGSATITVLLFSVGAFTYARHPEGIGEFLKRRLTLLLLRARPHASALSREARATEQVGQ